MIANQFHDFHHPLPRRPALDTRPALASAGQDAGLDQVFGKRGEVGFGIGLGCDFPDGALVAACVVESCAQAYQTHSRLIRPPLSDDLMDTLLHSAISLAVM